MQGRKISYMMGCAFLCALVITSHVSAYEPPSELMMRRCGRGVVNLLCAPIDVLNYMEDTRVKEGLVSGVTYGAFKGVSCSVARALYGVYEVATFYRYMDTERFEPTYNAPVIDLS